MGRSRIHNKQSIRHFLTVFGYGLIPIRITHAHPFGSAPHIHFFLWRYAGDFHFWRRVEIYIIAFQPFNAYAQTGGLIEQGFVFRVSLPHPIPSGAHIFFAPR